MWMLLFFAVPFLIVLKIAFSQQAIAIPPYTPILDVVGEAVTLKLNLSNFIELLRDAHYLQAYASSLKIAAISTFLCLLIGYPMAYAIARLPATSRNVALMLVILPSWISFLIRIYAWMGILQTNGLLNRALLGMGIVDEPLRLLNTPLAAYIGIVYAGGMLVMIPAVGEFVIPELLGGPDTLMIGRLLWSQFFNAGNWPMASAVAIVMLGLLLVPILVFHRFQQRELEGRLT